MRLSKQKTITGLSVFVVVIVIVVFIAADRSQIRIGNSPLRVINPRSIAYTGGNCTTARVTGLQFPICTYSAAEDPVVSKSIITGHYFELQEVEDTIRRLKDFPSATFLDIGTNVGVYSLAVAHSGHRVISVEPNNDTMRHLATSIVRGAISDRVTLLYNAVSNERTTLQLGVDLKNRGDSFLLPMNYCRENPNSSHCQRAAVNTVTLNDLISLLKSDHTASPKVFIKVDAQGSEIKIFDPQSAGDFLRHYDVVEIQMEWVLIPIYYNKSDLKRAEVERVLNYLYGLNYTVHPQGRPSSVLNSNWREWPYNVYLKKRRS